MRILYDIVHPADVHFFRHAIEVQRARGDQVLVTSRDKDIALDLLERFEIAHQPLTRRGTGWVGLLAELVRRDMRLLSVGHRFRPDILVANNSPCVAHVARLLGRPSLIFDDTEVHRLNRWLYRFLVTEVHSPDSFTATIGPRHVHYPSYHALAYLHPNHYHREPSRLVRQGLEPERKRVLMRFVDRGALHDLGTSGIGAEAKRRLVQALSRHAEVLISSEVALPGDLERYRCRAPLEEMHNLIAYSALVLGESATMCAEAAVLGTPAILIDSQTRGYAEDLVKRYGVCFRFPVDAVDAAIAKAHELLSPDNPRAAFAAAHHRLLQEHIDASAYQVEQIDRLVADSNSAQ